MDFFITENTPVNDAVLRAIAHIPTKSLPVCVNPRFWQKLADKDFMRIAVWLAQKSYDEGGCPIGGVIIDNETKQIMGKGHNTLVQESHPYNHGETSAVRDAGRIDFSRTTMFTTLTPCDICAAMCKGRGFKRIVIGNSPNPVNKEAWLRNEGVELVLLDDPMGIALYKKFQSEKPDLDNEDWGGVSVLKNMGSDQRIKKTG